MRAEQNSAEWFASETILREAALERDDLRGGERECTKLDERTYNVYTLSMDVLYQFGSLDFVWDVHKAAANIAKHGVRFEQACEVFSIPWCV
jgi:hypothetical protein